MPSRYTVRPGDTVVALAEAHGFLDHRPAWSHPDNASLRASDREPTILAPGDEVTIPDPIERSADIQTGRMHTFILAGGPLRLRVKLCEALGGPLAGVACELRADGHRAEATNGDGIVEERVSATTRSAELDHDGSSWSLDVGALEPVSTDAGLVARLNNLGYYAGEPGDPVDPERLRIAIEEFQLDQGKPRTGVVDDALRAQVRAEHGC